MCVCNVIQFYVFFSAVKWTIDLKYGIAISASSEMRYVIKLYSKLQALPLASVSLTFTFIKSGKVIT